VRKGAKRRKDARAAASNWATDDTGGIGPPVTSSGSAAAAAHAACPALAAHHAVPVAAINATNGAATVDAAATFKSKQLKELKNGRLAMIAVLGELMAQKVSGQGTYEQLASIADLLLSPDPVGAVVNSFTSSSALPF